MDWAELLRGAVGIEWFGGGIEDADRRFMRQDVALGGFNCRLRAFGNERETTSG